MKYFTNFMSRKIARRLGSPLWAVLLAALLIPATALSQSPAPLDLGCTETFAVLAGSTVTSTGATVIDGNIGLSPGSGVVGFPPATVVNGSIHINDALANNGKGCLTIAYNDAAGRTPVPTGPFLNPGAGNIGGLSLVAGLYKFTSTAYITGSNVTLTGGVSDVWIFQIASNLVVGNAVQVILAGGAQAKNIFWQVGTSATIGTTAIMKGTIMADQSISMNTGAVLDGRALARIGAVTMAGNTVNKPPLDNIPPAVISTIPVNLATGVPVNQSLTANFSEAMDPSTINGTTFTLKQGITPIAGIVTYSGVTATFNPTSLFAYNTVYTATITTGAKDLSGNPLGANYIWSFTTGSVPDTIPPTIISTVPSDTATNVRKDQNVSARFSEVMDPLTITGLTFTVKQGVTSVPGTVTHSGITSTFNPTSFFAYNTVYTATITTGAKDLSGNPLAANYVWTFTTGAAPDSIPPTVISVVPLNNATGVPKDQNVSATFSELMNASTITDATFTVKRGAIDVPGAVTYTGVTATFNPTSFLAYSTVYTATITTGAVDAGGNPLAANYVWTFTTAAAPDSIPPTVSSTDPANNATDVPVNQKIAALFSEVMNPATITTTTFTLTQGATAVPGAVTYVGLTATFSPTTFLAYSTLYTATITTGVKDLANHAMLSTYVWRFTTGAAPDSLAPTVRYTVPTANAMDVPVNQKITAAFSETMDPSTLTPATFVLRQGTTVVPGTVTYVGVTATFKPTSYLDYSTVYTATITAAATDLAGNPLASDYVWSFTTGAAPDTIAPMVSFTVPSYGAINIPANQRISASFTEAMDPASISTATFLVKAGATPVAGVVTYVGITATFTPTLPLANNTLYTVTISTGATDLAGNPIASDYVWPFTTGTASDTKPPTVTSTVPANGASSVHVIQTISATFSEVMDPLSISTTTFFVTESGNPVAGTVTYSGVTATFTPAIPFKYLTTYTVTMTTGVKDLAGNPMVTNYVWNFTTSAFNDITAPTVSSTIPANAATGVPANQRISATFSEAMDPQTISTLTFTVKAGFIPISGTVTYIGVTATFIPSVQLAYTTRYTATITTGAKDLAGNALASNYDWSFTTGDIPDVTPPTVISTIPVNAAINVPVNQKIVAVFSEAIDPLTITTATFTLMAGQTPIAGTVTYVGVTATFTPFSPLAFSTIYTATISTGVTDLAGNAMLSDYVWYFISGANPDDIAPFVRYTVPLDAATNVPVNQKIAAIFSEEMDPLTISTATFILKNGAISVPGVVTYVGLTATFTPSVNLAFSTTYTATISTGVMDLAANAMVADYVWTFSTGDSHDLTSPTVISTDPANNETGVVLNKVIAATFSEEMDPLTITSTSFTLMRGTQQVFGTITYLGAVAKFTPLQHLMTNTTYVATITTEATDLAGNHLVMNYPWSFTTGAALPGPLPIDLDCAHDFVILAGSTVTSTGNTIVYGDVGLSPGSAITGFPPGQVLNGTIHINDVLANNAKLCLTVAYNDAAGRTLNAIIVSDGELGGKTLAPGLYRSAPGSFGITNSDLTLDAQGDVNAVWLFQMPSSTLTVGNGRQVILAGGAQSKNIFWQVGSSATIGTTSVMKGTIMADQSITLNTGASLNGRALARIAAVTLNGNIITRPDIIVSVKNDKAPASFTLSQNYPNPFNPVTHIEYGVAKPGMISLRIYNVFGVEVATLVNTYQEAGNYIASFNSNDAKQHLTSGIYFYRLEAGEFVSMNRKLILLK